MFAIPRTLFAQDQRCIRIGLLGEFERKTGSFSQPFGKEILRGSEIALKEKSGDGKCIKFEKLDINNSLANIDGLIRKASESGIQIFLGLGTSDQSLAAIEALSQTDSLLITPTASSDLLIQKQSHTILMFPTNSVIAGAISKELHRMGVKSVLSIYSNHNAYSKNMNQEFRTAFKESGGKMREISVRAGRVDLTGHLQYIKSKRNEYIFLPLFELDAAKVIAQISRSGIKAKYIGADSWGTYSTVIKNLLKSSAIIATIPQIYDPGSRAHQNVKFISRYKNNFGELPSDLAAFSYDGANLAFRILENCPFTEVNNKLRACISNLYNIQTTMGKVQINSTLQVRRTDSIKFTNLKGEI